MDSIFWVAIFICTLVVEFMTMGLTTVWFSAGALVAIVVAVLGGPMWLQALVFFAVSLALLFFTRPLVAKYQKNTTVKTNIDSLIGKQVKVIADINNDEEAGYVTLSGVEWMARSATGEVIKADTMVTIVKIEGAKLIVK